MTPQSLQVGRTECPPRDSVTVVPFGLLLHSPGKAVCEGQGRDLGGAAGPDDDRVLSERPGIPALGSLGETSPFQLRPLGHSLWLSWLNTSVHLPSVTEKSTPC